MQVRWKLDGGGATVFSGEVGGSTCATLKVFSVQVHGVVVCGAARSVAMVWSASSRWCCGGALVGKKTDSCFDGWRGELRERWRSKLGRVRCGNGGAAEKVRRGGFRLGAVAGRMEE